MENCCEASNFFDGIYLKTAEQYLKMENFEEAISELNSISKEGRGKPEFKVLTAEAHQLAITTLKAMAERSKAIYEASPSNPTAITYERCGKLLSEGGIDLPQSGDSIGPESLAIAPVP